MTDIVLKPASAPSATEPLDRALRRLRPMVGAALGIYVIVRSGPTTWDTGTAIAALAAVVAIVAVTRTIGGRLKASPGMRKVGDAFSVAVDAGVTVFAITKLDLLDPQLGWALLVVPVLEGALKFRIRGAVVVWCAITAAYVALQISVPSNMTDPVTQTAFLLQIQTLVYRSGIVLLVAVPGGYLSDQLLRAISAQRLAQMDAAERNSLLIQVVEAGRSLSRWGADVPSTVVESSILLGFTVADWAYLDSRRGWVTSHRRAGHNGGGLPPPGGLDGMCAAAASSGRIMIADGDDESSVVRAALAEHRLETVLTAPIRGRDGTLAVLRVGTERGTAPTTQQIESLELLTGQASVAGDNAQLLGEIDEVRTDLEHQANHDVLTGLPNRAQFQRGLAQSLEEMAKRCEPLGLLFLDLDRFKEVNDHLGHEVGDELLVAVAQRLGALVRSESMVARLGGDEFIILSPATDAIAATTLADRIVARLGEPFRLQQHVVSVGASVGIVVTDSPIDAGELIRRGDLAMYQAKAHGRSTWRLYSPELDREGRVQARVETELRAAIDARQLAVAYQPVVRLADHRIVGVEALVRWNHPRIGAVPPDQFIPVAERSDLIDRLGHFMLEQACTQARRWSDVHPGLDLSIAVNVSPHEVRRPGFADRVLGLLRSAGVRPGAIVLELTERVIIDADVLEPLEMLRRAGIRIAVDDFGQGHTSVGTLSRLPIDILKIDRSFVTGLLEGSQQAAIVRSMINLGHDLGMDVIAEGVEQADEARILGELGCDQVQGYHLHPPMSTAGFEALLARPDPTGESLPSIPSARQSADLPSRQLRTAHASLG